MGMTNTTTPAATECTTLSVLSAWFFGADLAPCHVAQAARCGACAPETGYDAARAENAPSERLYAFRGTVCAGGAA